MTVLSIFLVWSCQPEEGENVPIAHDHPPPPAPPPCTMTPNTPLNWKLADAVERGDTETARRLLARGASATARMNRVGYPRKGDRLIAQMPEKYYWTNRVKYIKVFRLLVRSTKNVNAADGSGDTLLRSAVYMDDPSTVEWLIKRGATIDSKRLLLMVSPKQSAPNNRAIMRHLLENGADPNVANEDGETPLVLAAQFGDPEIVGMMLKHKADPAHRTHYGFTARDWAKKRGLWRIVAMLPPTP
ncbi:MAG: ankyrin repeat domain-containing protein [Akkermansiaceae bacterium]|nr:ankyrin repeat domain-containing protein [Armatimonadota bacterium]